MTDSPWTLLLLLAGSAYLSSLWWQDFQATRQGRAPAGALPGATSARPAAITLAVAGGLVIVAAETWGELRLGLADQQSQVTVLFCAYTLLAAVVEEIIFRGYLILPESRGRLAVWSGALGASVLFALAHPFLWSWEEGRLSFHFTPKGWFSTGAVFASSLWFYFVRLMPGNPSRSLLPCFAAHAAKNLAVIGIKAAQGFVVGWW